MTNRKVKFWKIVGGYTYCIKWRGRWHYLGQTVGEYMYARKVLKDLGYRMERVGEPGKIRAVWAEHGCTLAALKKNLPIFDGLTAK